MWRKWRKKKPGSWVLIYLRSYLSQQHTSVIQLKWTHLTNKTFKAKSRSKGKHEQYGSNLDLWLDLGSTISLEKVENIDLDLHHAPSVWYQYYYRGYFRGQTDSIMLKQGYFGTSFIAVGQIWTSLPTLCLKKALKNAFKGVISMILKF